ncbi:galactose-1-phosphate uridylyltransferase [Methanolacinia paynteri]|uniref:galactose-1-phosphate uridylyltransferase n=1 Tax=Methanolacinia paynteri TaxID=230356 RepID=UPI00064EA1B1|nr:galactose-1-phosphate uridylyltransferase [Methanolacinia paynteri]
MFSKALLDINGRKIEYREETLTGIRCRICPSREERGLNDLRIPEALEMNESCPFCPENIEKDTPCFETGERIHVGESTTFPNIYPFGENHIVTVITREHCPHEITENQILDSLKGQFLGLKEKEGFATINWNYLSSAGASMIHPHLQGFSEGIPTYLTSLYINRSKEYFDRTGSNYWLSVAESEKESERYLFGDEITWCANPVPTGEKEIRGYLPFCSFNDFEEFIPEIAGGIRRVMEIYKNAGNHALNMAIRFGKDEHERYFRAFVSIIARINPNPESISDSAFMERLHFEPVVMTVPEDLKRIDSRFQKY